MRALFLSVMVVAVSFAWAEEPEAPAPAPAQPAAAPAAPTAKDFADRLDELWKTRDDAATAKASEQAIADGLKAFPDDYGVLWRAARYKWWVADGLKDDAKKKMGKEGWGIAEKAVKKNPNGVEGRYFQGITIGAYSQGAGILTALGEGLEGKFNENIDLALKLDESFDRHGPLVSKGRYYWELPWPKRNLDKSRDLLKKVVAKRPEHLRAWLFLAETELKDGNAKEAKVAIDKVNSLPVDYDPPEGRRIKAMAKSVTEEIEKKLK